MHLLFKTIRTGLEDPLTCSLPISTSHSTCDRGIEAKWILWCIFDNACLFYHHQFLTKLFSLGWITPVRWQHCGVTWARPPSIKGRAKLNKSVYIWWQKHWSLSFTSVGRGPTLLPWHQLVDNDLNLSLLTDGTTGGSDWNKTPNSWPTNEEMHNLWVVITEVQTHGAAMFW